jgi:quercetin dioxygenase-like cupin family protein
MRHPNILVIALAPFVATAANAQVKFSSTPLLKSSATVAGVPISCPKTDSAEVSAVRLEIGAGGETGRHRHPYPTFVDVLEGATSMWTAARCRATKPVIRSSW